MNHALFSRRLFPAVTILSCDPSSRVDRLRTAYLQCLREIPAASVPVDIRDELCLTVREIADLLEAEEASDADRRAGDLAQRIIRLQERASALASVVLPNSPGT